MLPASHHPRPCEVSRSLVPSARTNAGQRASGAIYARAIPAVLWLTRSLPRFSTPPGPRSLQPRRLPPHATACPGSGAPTAPLQLATRVPALLRYAEAGRSTSAAPAACSRPIPEEKIVEFAVRVAANAVWLGLFRPPIIDSNSLSESRGSKSAAPRHPAERLAPAWVHRRT